MFFVFFKHKTAYEMRISDWSSDVCSSDLAAGFEHAFAGPRVLARPAHVLAGLRRHMDDDAIAFEPGVLLHHHRIRARRQRRAGGDAHALARVDAKFERVAGELLAEIGRAHV